MAWSPPKQAKIFGHLVNEVVRRGTCMMCGACVASCPINVLYAGENEEPVIRGPCAACQVCYYSCPRLELPLDEIEQLIFGRTRTPDEEILGIYRAAYSARATDEEIWTAGQDGGTTMALLKHAMDIGMIDAAVTTNFTNANSLFILNSGKPLAAVPLVVSDSKGILDTAGSKYTHSSTIAGLGEAAASFPGGRIALVALPCELQGLWRMHTALQATVKFGGSGIVGGRPIFTIGLFCSKVFNYDKLYDEYIKGKHGVDLNKVTRTAIKKGRFKVYVGGEEVINVTLKELEPYAQDYCKYCIDYAAELADISIGAIGSPEGWTTVLVRTEIGEKLFESAVKNKAIEAVPIEHMRPGLAFLRKLAEKKKLENYAYYLKRGGAPPPIPSAEPTPIPISSTAA